MFAERFPDDIVAAERDRLGSAGFSGQHQQEPINVEGAILRPDHLVAWPVDSPLPTFSRIVISLDAAYSTRSSADFSVALVVGEFDKGVMLLDLLRARLAYPQLRQAIIDLAARHRPHALLIEETASGQSLLQELRQATSLPVVGIRPVSDKATRAHACAPSVEAGRVFYPASAPWFPALASELVAFPRGAHDDQVDAFTQAVSYMTAVSGPSNLIAFWRQQRDGTLPTASLADRAVTATDLSNRSMLFGPDAK